MSSFVLAIVGWIRLHRWWTVAIILSVAGIIGIIVLLSQPKKPQYITDTAIQGDLVQTVEVIGTVISERDLELSLPVSDVVSDVLVDEGDLVKAGQILLRLRSGQLSAQVSAAQANVAIMLSQLKALEEGSRPEDIAITQAGVENKRASLAAAKENLRTAEENILSEEQELTTLRNESKIALRGQATVAETTVEQQIAVAKTALSVTEGVFMGNDVNDAVVHAQPRAYEFFKKALDQAQIDLASFIVIPDGTLDGATLALTRARSMLSSVAAIITQGYDVLSDLSLTAYFTNENRETAKSTVATQRSNAQSALASLDSALKTIRDINASYDTKIVAQINALTSARGAREKASADLQTSKAALDISIAELALKQAPSRTADLDGSRARLSQAKAELDRAISQLNDTILRAPVAGVITAVKIKKGEKLSTGPVVTMLGDAPYRIEAFVPEVDIPRIQLAQSGSIELDAFPNLFLPLIASEVDPGPTDIDGVPKYRITLDFLSLPQGIKLGMTGDLEVITGIAKDVISVPTRSIVSPKDRKAFVRILKEDGTLEEREVEIGLEGANGRTAVKGIDVGDTVVVLIKI